MPKPKQAKDVKTLTVDSDTIMGFQAKLFPLTQQSFVIERAEGYEDADGNFIPVKPLPSIPLVGDELTAFMNKTLTDIIKEMNPNVTVFEALQSMMYSKM